MTNNPRMILSQDFKIMIVKLYITDINIETLYPN